MINELFNQSDLFLNGSIGIIFNVDLFTMIEL
jgi:hypothetical protein